jgi:hypothetical protein
MATLHDNDLLHDNHSLISADRVAGTAVYDSSREKIGSIDTVMIDKQTGNVAYAVMSFGGFLGIGEKYHPLPWDVLSYDSDLGGYNVGMAGASFRDAPSYGRDEIDAWDRDRVSTRVDDYYADTARSGYGGAGNGAGMGTMPTAAMGGIGMRGDTSSIDADRDYGSDSNAPGSVTRGERW